MSWLLFPFNLLGLGWPGTLGFLLLAPWAIVWLPPLVVGIRPGRAQGLALPGLVLADRCDPAILRHEFAHTRQMRRWSPLGVALFLGWHYGRAMVAGQSFLAAYRVNPLEVAACREADLHLPLLRHGRLRCPCRSRAGGG